MGGFPYIQCIIFLFFLHGIAAIVNSTEAKHNHPNTSVDSLNRILMVVICYPYPVKFALKKMLVSFGNSNQNVDGNSPKLGNEKNSKANNEHLGQLRSIP